MDDFMYKLRLIHIYMRVSMSPMSGMTRVMRGINLALSIPEGWGEWRGLPFFILRVCTSACV